VPRPETVQFNLAKAFDTLVETLADRECIVWRDRRLSYADLQERSRRLASYLHDKGLGVRKDRADLAGWESGQDHVALALYNGNEYLEGMLGSYRARVAPFNVNYRYVGEELRYLLNDARPRALILHASLAPTLAEVLPTLDDEFAKDIGSGQTLVELRANVHTELEKTLRNRADTALAEQIVVRLNEKNTVDLPPSLVERQCQLLEAELLRLRDTFERERGLAR